MFDNVRLAFAALCASNANRMFERFFVRTFVLAATAAACSAYGEEAALPLHVCYRSFNDQLERTADFARGGVTERCFFAANTVKAGGAPYCSYPMIWKGEGLYDFAAFDAQMENMRKASPDGRFLVIVDLNTPPWLTRRFGLDSFALVSHLACDERWFKITERYMRDFFAHVESKYAGCVSGYVLSGGGTSEWYEYDAGVSSRMKNAGWRRWCEERRLPHGPAVPDETALGRAAFENLVYDPATEGEKIDYWRFHNGIIADAVLRYAKVARSAVPREREIAVFFGYFLVSDARQVSFGHLDYDRVFASPDIDFLIAPANYSERGMGAAGGQQLMTGSVRRHGKRFLHEIDFGPHTQTFWRPGTWKSQDEDIAGNLREAAFACVNHASFWWFDMWGGKNGFYDDPEVRRAVFKVSDVARQLADDASPVFDEILFVADPESLYYVNERDGKARAFGEHLRNELGRTGIPYDTCSWNDLAHRDLSRTKMVCLPSLLLVTPERARFLEEKVCTNGRTVLFTYAPGLTDGRTLDKSRVKRWAGVGFATGGVSVTKRGEWTSVYACDHRLYDAARLRELALAAGVTPVLDRPATVFMNDGLLTIHSAEGGRFNVTLPQAPARVTDLLRGGTVAENARTFVVKLSRPDTVMLRLER